MMELPANAVAINDSLFTLLMNEAFGYLQSQVKSIPQLEERLKDLGLHTGRKCLELYGLRQRIYKRQTSLLELLGWLSGDFWRWLFGKAADSLEKNTEVEGEFMIWENAPVYCTFNSTPKELGDFSVASFTAGIVEAVLCACWAVQCRVSAHCCPMEEPDRPNRTLYLIRFE